MPARVLAGTLTTILLTAVLLFLGAGLLSLDGASSAAAAFFDQGPRAVVAIVGIPFLVWALLLLAADFVTRTRTAAIRFLIGGAVTVTVALLALVFWVAFAALAGGFAALLIAIALIHLLAFCVAGLIALAVTHLVLFRRPPVASAAAA